MNADIITLFIGIAPKKVKKPKSWYAGMFDEIANKLDVKTGDEVKLSDARRSLEFVTAVYNSSRENKNIKFPINKENPLYSCWLPKIIQK